jgi:hypothetical protein
MRAVSQGARRIALVVVVALLAPVGVVASTAPPAGAALPACTVSWVSPVDGDWQADEGWSTGFAPNEDDHVCITVAGSYTVTVDGSTEPIASLRVGTAAGTTTQTLHLASGDLTATGGVEVSPRGHVLLEPAPGAPFGPELFVGPDATTANAGTIEVLGEADQRSGLDSLVNAGMLRVETDLGVADGFTNDGTIVTGTGVEVRVQATLWTRGGQALGRGTFEPDVLRVGAMDAPFTDSTGSVFVARNAEISFEGDGTLQISVLGNTHVTGTPAPDQLIRVTAVGAQSAQLSYAGPWTSDATIELRPSATSGAYLTPDAPELDVFVNEGTVVRVPATGGVASMGGDVVNRGGIDTGGGVLAVSGDLRNDATIDLRLGEIAVGGDLDLPLGSVVHHGIRGGGDPDVGHLTVGGTATLAGLLITHTDDEAVPAPGAVAAVVEAAARTGTFREILFWGPASYDTQHTATRLNLIRRASETPTRRFVRAAFQDFLDRQPDLKELSNHAGTIDSGNGTRASLVRSLSRSPEYVTTLVQRFYADTLGRPGDPGGVAFWVGELRSGRKTVAEVAGSFYASPEYFTRAGGTNQAWITDLYGVFFERAPTSGDLTYWTGRIGSRGRTRVAVELFQSLESRRQRVDRLYQELLGRDGDAGGVDYWAGRLTREGDLALAVDLASSGEYLDRAQIRYP